MPPPPLTSMSQRLPWRFVRQLPAWTTRSMELQVKDTESGGGRRGGKRGRLTVEVAVSVDVQCWQLHTISPRAADLLGPTMAARVQWNLRVRPTSDSSVCSCTRSRKRLTSPAISYSFQFLTMTKLLYYQLLWQSFGVFFKNRRQNRLGWWPLIGLWSVAEKLFSANRQGLSWFHTFIGHFTVVVSSPSKWPEV